MLVETRSNGTVSKNSNNSGFRKATTMAYLDCFDIIWHFITNLCVSAIKSIITFLLMMRQMWKCWPSSPGHTSLQSLPLEYLGQKKLKVTHCRGHEPGQLNNVMLPNLPHYSHFCASKTKLSYRS